MTFKDCMHNAGFDDIMKNILRKEVEKYSRKNPLENEKDREVNGVKSYLAKVQKELDGVEKEIANSRKK